MKAFNNYLIFNGNCREAMEFYANSLGAELQLMKFSEVSPVLRNQWIESCTRASRKDRQC